MATQTYETRTIIGCRECGRTLVAEVRVDLAQSAVGFRNPLDICACGEPLWPEYDASEPALLAEAREFGARPENISA
jgi:hypothetical protein